ncbi:MAG: phosphoribosyl-ATP diphosphatase [Gammaproteobacteria bacterium]|nr:phosphoribosyl-ATP diphosphatase [Gammaproteobacteria bacterium]
MSDILTKLEKVLEGRKTADADTSYVASLYQAGQNKILKKLGEEAVEVIIASQSETREQVIHEMADLWFHALILLVHKGIPVSAVTDELARRFGVSGIEEKVSRAEK